MGERLVVDVDHDLGQQRCDLTSADAVQVRLADVGGSPGEASSLATATTVDTTGPAAPTLASASGSTPLALGASTQLTISFDSAVTQLDLLDLVDSKGGLGPRCRS